MILNPFQVRLKEDNTPQGFKLGLVGTCVGMIPTKTDTGLVEVYKVLWFNYDEETGDMTPFTGAAAPSSHLATELVGFVDDLYIDDEEDDDEDTTQDDLFDDVPGSTTPQTTA